ncbi:MAG: NFACT family protein, partial [Clostridia bacterium]|nr:NFACT family protein [Clostridia bacterium]
MAFDGIITNAVVQELSRNLINSRVEKIYMPTKNDVILNFHANREKLKLLISIDASNARFHFTKNTKENPAKPPQFCMVIRKYIQGAKLIQISQYGLDRVVSFEFETFNELGDCTHYSLFIELMGKYSNIILVNPENKILDSIRHVDFTMSSVREVLPA